MANERARALRKAMTDGERRLWRELRGKQVKGMRFRRQHPIGPYIADFVCLEKRLVVEVDGGQHAEPAHVAHDRRRDGWLEREGYRVIRFTASEVMSNTAGIVRLIWGILNGDVTLNRRTE